MSRTKLSIEKEIFLAEKAYEYCVAEREKEVASLNQKVEEAKQRLLALRMTKAEGVTIKDLGFSTMTYNTIDRNGIFNLRQLAALSERKLHSLRRFGNKAWREVREAVHEHGLEFAPYVRGSLPFDLLDEESDL